MDPFYQVRQDIQDGLRDLQPRLARFHALPLRSPERARVAQAARQSADALSAQTADLSAAVDAASRDPARFGLAAEEVEGRRRWVSSARAQIDGTLAALRAAEEAGNGVRSPLRGGADEDSAAAAAGGNDAPASPNDNNNNAKPAFSDPHQQMLVRRQDEQLEDVEQGLARLARVGVAIRDELQEQGGMLDSLGADVDAARARLGGVGKKMRDVLARSGTSNRQLALIAALMLVLVGLVVLVMV